MLYLIIFKVLCNSDEDSAITTVSPAFNSALHKPQENVYVLLTKILIHGIDQSRSF